MSVSELKKDQELNTQLCQEGTGTEVDHSAAGIETRLQRAEAFEQHLKATKAACFDELTYAGSPSLLRRNFSEGSMSIVGFSVTGLKQYNETYGYKEGDQVLQDAAGLIHAAFKSLDGSVYRVSGTTFLVAYPTPTTSNATIEERLTDRRFWAAAPLDLPPGLNVGQVAVKPHRARVENSQLFVGNRAVLTLT